MYTHRQNRFKHVCKGQQALDMVKKLKNDINYIMNSITVNESPLSNFSQTSSLNVDIDGVTLSKNSVIGLIFSDNYNSVTQIPSNFLSSFSNLSYIDLSEMLGITQLMNSCFAGCTKLTNIDFPNPQNITGFGLMAFNGTGITNIDLSNFTSLTRFSDGLCENCHNLVYANLSGLSQLTQSGRMFVGCSKLDTIFIGSVDWQDKTVSSMSFMNTVNNGTIQSSTQQLGETFRNKFTNLSNWTIQVV